MSHDHLVSAAGIQNAYSSLGVNSVLFIPVGFSGGTTASPWSSDAVRDGLFAQIQSYFSACSYGAFSLSFNTTPLRIINTENFYSAVGAPGSNALIDQIYIDAKAGAVAAGYNPNNYPFIVIVFNTYASWLGAGAYGRIGEGKTWINGGGRASLAEVYNHEIGHNLGLDHANAWNPNGLVPDSLDGAHVEYGNIYDTMGYGGAYFGHFTASFKNQLGWLPNQYVTTVSSNITMNLYGMDATLVAGRKYAAKISIGNKVSCWIEFRSAYSSLGAIISKAAPIGSGVIGPIVYGGAESLLLDMIPKTETFADSGLKVGKTFKLSDGSFEIKVNSQSGSGADAFINVTITAVASPSRGSRYETRRKEINNNIKKLYGDSSNTNSLPNSKSITPQNFTERVGSLRTGWRPDKYDSRDYEFDSDTTPADTDLTSSPNMPPVFDQGGIGSCVANACLSAMMFLLKSKGIDVELSRLFTYYAARTRSGNINQDSGTTNRCGIKSMDLIGACLESLWTYSDEGTKWKKKPDKEAYKNARLQNLKRENIGYFRIKDKFFDDVLTEAELSTEIKKALTDGHPVVFGIECADHQWMMMSEPGDGVVAERSGEEITGGHAMLIVGSDGDYFKVRNSWGEETGEDGNVYIHKNDMFNDGADFWVLLAAE